MCFCHNFISHICSVAHSVFIFLEWNIFFCIRLHSYKIYFKSSVLNFILHLFIREKKGIDYRPEIEIFPRYQRLISCTAPCLHWNMLNIGHVTHFTKRLWRFQYFCTFFRVKRCFNIYNFIQQNTKDILFLCVCIEIAYMHINYILHITY